MYKLDVSQCDINDISKLETENEYECDMIDKDGIPCGAIYSRLQALTMHQRSSANHVHQHVSIADLVVGNACIFCETILASRAMAIQHVKNSIKTKKCKNRKNIW